MNFRLTLFEMFSRSVQGRRTRRRGRSRFVPSAEALGGRAVPCLVGVPAVEAPAAETAPAASPADAGDSLGSDVSSSDASDPNAAGAPDTGSGGPDDSSDVVNTDAPGSDTVDIKDQITIEID